MFLCSAAYAIMLMYALLFLCSGVGVCAIGWNMYGCLLRGEMEYAQGWSDSDRKALSDFEVALRQDYKMLASFSDILRKYDIDNIPPSDSVLYTFAEDKSGLSRMRRINDDLRAMVSQAPGNIKPTPRMAHAAAEMGHLAALVTFIKQGADVNSILPDDDATLLARVLTNYGNRPEEYVFTTAEWLVYKGAVVKQSDAIQTAIICSDNPNASLSWLLAHGLETSLWKWNDEIRRLPLDSCVATGMALDEIEKLVKSGAIDINSRKGHLTYLQDAVSSGASEKAIRFLFRMGARPDEVPEPMPEDTPEDREYSSRPPLVMLLDIVSQTVPEADDCSADEQLNALRLLLEHGATPQPFPSEWASPEIRKAAEEIYKKAGYSPSSEQTRPTTSHE